MLKIDSIKEYMTNNVTKNIEWIKSNYGDKFELSTDLFSMPATISKGYLEISEIEYFVLEYDSSVGGEDIPRSYILPFSINFYDPVITEINNDVYIANISRTKKIRGSDVVKFVLHVLRILGVEKAYLHDGTQIECSDGTKIDLSLYKLMEKSIPYYMNFGFKFYVDPKKSNNLRYHFKSDDMIKRVLDKTLQVIRNLKITDLINTYEQLVDICADSIKKADTDNFIVKRFSTVNETPPSLYVSDYKSEPVNFIWKAKVLMDILRNTKASTFRELIMELVNSGNCHSYDQLISLMLYEYIYSYEYGTTIIKTEYVRTFALLMLIRESVAYVYDFRKE